MLSIAAAFCWM